MRLVYESGGVERDLEMRAGRPDAVVGDLAEALGVGVGIHGGVRAGVGVGVGTATTGAGPGLWIDGRWCPPDVPLHESGIVEGARVGAADTERSVSVADQASHVLRVVGGLDAGAERRLGIGRVVLGRGRSDGVNLSSPVVSQAHCVVDVAADGTVTVADLGSANGTDVNGTRLRGPRRVTAADLVGLGGGVAIRILPAAELSPVRRLNPAREVRAGPVPGSELMLSGSGTTRCTTIAPRPARRPPRTAAANSPRRRSRCAVANTRCPGGSQAESRARPLARRAERIARPARVRIRSRKPWVFARRRLFGW